MIASSYFLFFLLAFLLMFDKVVPVVGESRRVQSSTQLFLRRWDRRQLYDFVAPTIRDCKDSGLLSSCPFQDTTTLFTGSCDSGIQQRYTDLWCYTESGTAVCCGTSAQDCCEANSGYVAAISIAVVLIVSPFVLLIACAYGRCCPWYARLWNSKSNRGCGRPRPKASDDNSIEEKSIIKPPEVGVTN